MKARNKIDRKKKVEKTFNILDVSAGDIVKFSGTRNQGYRKIIQMELQGSKCCGGDTNYFSRVVDIKKGEFIVTNFTSNNSGSKMTWIYLNGEWVRITR